MCHLDSGYCRSAKSFSQFHPVAASGTAAKVSPVALIQTANTTDFDSFFDALLIHAGLLSAKPSSWVGPEGAAACTSQQYLFFFSTNL